MSKLFILSVVIFLSIGLWGCPLGRANATGQELQGYIYSDGTGWISLNCVNTNSCDLVNYKVLEDSNGSLSGYGYSQNSGWVNFNPNYGGVSIASGGTVSGWVYSEKGDWLRIDQAKVVLATDLQTEVVSAENTIASQDLSSVSTMSLLNSLCNKIFSASMCASIVNY